MLNKNKNIFDHLSCLSKEELISYAKGALSEKEKNYVERHLLDCELCAEALDGILLLNDPSGLNIISSDLIRKLDEKRPVAKKNKIRSAYLIAAAAVACIFIISGIYFALIQNPENLKSEMAVLPIKNEEIQSARQPSNVADTTTANSNKSLINTIASEANKELTEKEKKEPQNEMEQTVVAETAPDLSEKDTEASVPKPSSEVYNDLVAINEKALETVPVDTDKKMIPSKNEAKISMVNKKAANNEGTSNAGVRQEVQKSEAISVDATYLQKNKSLPQANVEERLIDVQEKLKYENYSDALKELDHLSNEYVGNINVIYFTGIVYYKTNELVKALSCFDAVLDNGDKKLFEEARLQKALTYIKMNDKPNARKLLSQIIAEKSIYKERAEGILEQIDGN